MQKPDTTQRTPTVVTDHCDAQDGQSVAVRAMPGPRDCDVEASADYGDPFKNAVR